MKKKRMCIEKEGQEERMENKELSISFLSQYDAQRKEELEEYLGYALEIQIEMR